MPATISKEEATRRLAELLPEGACAMCGLVAKGEPLHALATTTLEMNGFPLRWGHLLVVSRRHVTTFSDLTDREHEEASRLVLAGARALERSLRPGRVFTASLGTAREGVPMSTAHLHWHLVPVAHPGERPADVLSWSNGVVSASPDEWSSLRRKIMTELSGNAQDDVRDVHPDP
jgi:diadenosine tetraphosphate (Ap4A) HIT family hydrolase